MKKRIVATMLTVSMAARLVAGCGSKSCFPAAAGCHYPSVRKCTGADRRRRNHPNHRIS